MTVASIIKRVRMIRYSILPVFLLLVGFVTQSQDLHYSDVETMNLWYNQSLKMEKRSDVRFNFRDIKYVIFPFKLQNSVITINSHIRNKFFFLPFNLMINLIMACMHRLAHVGGWYSLKNKYSNQIHEKNYAVL